MARHGFQGLQRLTSAEAIARAERDAAILERRRQGARLREIAAEHHLTVAQVCRIIQRELRELRREPAEALCELMIDALLARWTPVALGAAPGVTDRQALQAAQLVRTILTDLAKLRGLLIDKVAATDAHGRSLDLAGLVALARDGGADGAGEATDAGAPRLRPGPKPKLRPGDARLAALVRWVPAVGEPPPAEGVELGDEEPQPRGTRGALRPPGGAGDDT
jgi:hypothetical protein